MSRAEGERGVNVIQGKYDSLTLYEVTDDELELLKNGPASSIYFNIAIALLPFALGLLITVFTASFKSYIVFTLILLIALVSLFAGAITLIIWFNTKGNYGTVISRIRARTEKEDKSVITIDTPDGATSLATEDIDIMSK